jgi:hypothetical protein
VSFRHSDPHEPNSAAAKFVALAVVVLLALGAAAYWFLKRAPEPSVTRTPAPAPAAEPETPPPPPREAPAPSPPREDTVAGPGALRVSASIEGASVYLDGELVGEAPYRNEQVSAGRHEIRVEKEGYQPFISQVRIRPGATSELTASLTAAPPSLTIVSDIPGATVFLDRNYIGTTPVEIKEVAAGEHQLTVSADGFDMHAETLSLTAGHRDVMVNFKDVSLSESIAVVHKHGMGSCKGTLIADDSGLRYETSNKGDAFRVPFPGVERFEVDYIDKNLNVKVRKGKNYNFTDAQGNADALFVFHKNVQAFLAKK